VILAQDYICPFEERTFTPTSVCFPSSTARISFPKTGSKRIADHSLFPPFLGSSFHPPDIVSKTTRGFFLFFFEMPSKDELQREFSHFSNHFPFYIDIKDPVISSPQDTLFLTGSPHEFITTSDFSHASVFTNPVTLALNFFAEP